MRLINFRNYKNIDLELDRNLNIFIGNNAQGKTNLIEAIYLCAAGKSFRTNRDKELINFNKEEAYIGLEVSMEKYSKLIEIKFHQNKAKRIRINKQELESHKDLNSGLSVVVFTPEDLKIVKGGPNQRRKFLDTGISKIKPVYNYNISKYRKILYQRNNLLRSSKFKRNIEELLDVFDNQIIKIGTNIILNRYSYVEKLNKISNIVHKEITEGKENLSLDYVSNVPILESREKIEEEYLKLMRQNLRRDMEYSTTEIGPHRDDIGMFLNGKDARIYGSQGQQRTTILSIILSEVRLLKQENGMYPVLLLDDVFSELDDSRKLYLSGFFKNIQTFITTTEKEDLKSMVNRDKKIFTIKNGDVV